MAPLKSTRIPVANPIRRRTQEAVLGELNALDSKKLYTSRDVFLKDLKAVAKQVLIELRKR